MSVPVERYQQPNQRKRAHSVPIAEQRYQEVAVIGAPNAGKSTLLNKILGTKVSIVSPKAQTTRERVIGIHTSGDCQTVFLDTPGVLPFGPQQKRIPGQLSRSSWLAASEADMLVVVIDAAAKVDEKVEFILGEMKRRGLRGLLVLNKVDLVHPKDRLLPLAERLFAAADFHQCFMISALKGSGLEPLLEELKRSAPQSPWLYAEDQFSDASPEVIAEELIREKVYQRLNQELPYILTQKITSWQERRDGSLDIEAQIYVQTVHQKKVVVGSGGEVIKTIRTAAQRDLARALRANVRLSIQVGLRNKDHTNYGL